MPRAILKGADMNSIDKKVLELDLKNLTAAELDWLHDLKAKAQRMYIARYYKSQGIDRKMKKVKTLAVLALLVVSFTAPLLHAENMGEWKMIQMQLLYRPLPADQGNGLEIDWHFGPAQVLGREKEEARAANEKLIEAQMKQTETIQTAEVK